MYPLPFLSTIHPPDERTVEKKTSIDRSIDSMRRNRDRWVPADRYFHASNVSIDKSTDRMEDARRVGKTNENERNENACAHCHVARDDDARETTTTTTNDAMAKYYGDIAKAAKGT